jgi:hypothetical protein
MIAAEVDGGKQESRHRMAVFAPQTAAVDTRSATKLTQMRRPEGSDPPLREFRHFAALFATT